MKTIVLGITGASGAAFGVRFLTLTKDIAEVHCVVSDAGWQVVADETGLDRAAVSKLAAHLYNNDDLHTPIASGSFGADGMVVLPCSIKSLSAIVNCYSDTLLIRAADVTLKQRRPLVLGVRETPLHAGHLSLMQRAHHNGAIIAPPVPAMYQKPQTIENMIDNYVFMVLDLLGIHDPRYKRWGNAP